MSRLIPSAALGLTLAVLPLGCGHDEDHSPAAQEAQAAVGLPDQGAEKATEVQRDVLVIEEKKVVDAHSGAVLRDKKEVTPVTVVKEISTDVDVKVGETKVSDKGTAPLPAAK